ncbi:hypothetical protein WJT86_11330 [Microvirga sp. W0021]|uniref:Uncharacterized protein n=1 Tax=Hohaiivirga grylli TaxID=3133970 RepID=A0ABV0BLU5_9HYPH
MGLASGSSASVVRFRNGQAAGSHYKDQKCFMDAVYAAGSLPVSANDYATKRMAVRLTIFGFVVIDEISSDGTARRLKPSEAFHSHGSQEWLVSKPSAKAVGEVSLVLGGQANFPRPIVG